MSTWTQRELTTSRCWSPERPYVFLLPQNLASNSGLANEDDIFDLEESAGTLQYCSCADWCAKVKETAYAGFREPSGSLYVPR